MADYGRRIAEKAYKTVNRKLRSNYRRAEKEMTEKLAGFVSKFQEKSERMLAKVDAGEITMDAYKAWLAGQVFTKENIAEKIVQIQAVLAEHDKAALNIIQNTQLGVFAGNYNYVAKTTSRVTGVSFSMYSEEAVAKLIKSNPQILPKWKIDEEKSYKWSYKKTQGAIRQGIIQGESIDKITDRLTESLCAQDENRMRLFARTGITEAQNAGRIEMLHNAEDMGIKVRKVWSATHDNRTRDSHAWLDGEDKDVDEEFSNGLMYPGDPQGDPAEVYNCRCRLTYIYPDYM